MDDPTTSSPPRGPKALTIALFIGIGLLALILGVALGPWVKASLLADETEDAAGDTWYMSQMHPWIIQREPGQCPICGMDLTPIDPDDFVGELAIDPVVVQNMGVRTALAEEGRLERRVRSVGVVVVDPERVHEVTLRVDGWVDEVHVASQWEGVERGEPLLSVVSPRLTTALGEARIAAERADRELALVLRERLRFFGLDETTIDDLLAAERVPDAITMRAPVGGVLIAPPISAGSRLSASTVTHRIADLSALWVEITVAEHDLPFVAVGQDVELVFPRAGLGPRAGTIEAIYPVVDPRTRSATARVLLANEDGALRPGMYAIAESVARADEPAVLMPETASVGIGERRTVFVALGRGRFEPRDVVLGARGSGGLVEVRSGVAAGERVVTSGQFLLDSESDRRAAIARMMRGDLAAAQSAVAVEGGEVALGAPAREQLSAALRIYLDLQAALYDDDLAASRARAATGASAVDELTTAIRSGDAHADHRLSMLAELATAADQLALAAEGDLRALRVAFGALSIPLIELVEAVGVPPAIEGDLAAMHCTMADFVPEGGKWIQPMGAVRNPFFGAEAGMAGCALEDWILPRPGGETETAATGTGADGAEDQAGAVTADDATVPERSQQAVADPADPGSPPPPPATVVRALDAVGAALYAGDLVAVQARAAELTNALALAPTWSGHDQLALAAHVAEDLEAARTAYGSLSAIVHRSLADGAPGLVADLDTPLRVYHCGMARMAEGKGLWLQLGAEPPRNPYFGGEHAMSDCAIAGWRVTAAGLEEIDW